MNSNVVAGISGNCTSNATGSGGGYPLVRAGGGRRDGTGDSVKLKPGGRGVLPGLGDPPVRRYAVKLFYLKQVLC